MPAPQVKQPDQKQIVAFLARESQVPIDDVAVLYENARAELAVGAHVTKFVHIFAIRNVQKILLKRSVDAQAAMLRDAALLAA